MTTKSTYLIGIDLGTTNCTVAYSRKVSEEEPCSIQQFKIPQMVRGGEQGMSYSLPSFIYYPLPEELSAHAAAIEWDASRRYCVGSFAANRGGELPARMISSAKSWLCHAAADRRGPILPFDSEDVTLQKISPLAACSEMLRHIRESWDHTMPGDPFASQQVFVTVPASFDPSARQLVQEAAEVALFPEIVLLEEPQAAFYAWLYAHKDTWRETLKVGDTILVVDIGGGTTDFSLIEVEENAGDLSLRRKAVGAHLLLGGDNIDLALAYSAKAKLEDQGHEIDSRQLASLVQQCRRAKEILGSDAPPGKVDLTLLGKGSKLMSGTIKTEITLKEVSELMLDGFMPMIGPEERSLPDRGHGIRQVGLPYAQDPRISCQLAKFLSMTGESETGKSDEFVIPAFVLFNGGTMKSPALRKRVSDLLNHWAKSLAKPAVRELPGADYDFAVSKGAVNYGLALSGQSIRIRSGTSRSYFIGVEEAVPAVPGLEPPMQAVCIVPFGMEEGEERRLEDREFSLLLGQQATFRFLSRATAKLSNGTEPEPGTVVRNWKKELTELHPIETVLDKKEGEGKVVRVKLKSKVTELGMLELWCEGAEDRKWKLEFDIRNEKSTPGRK